MALQQADARAPYTSWGWAQQAVGVEMPMVPHQETGAEPVALDDTDLLVTPAEALELYAKLLTEGEEADPDVVLAPTHFQIGTHIRIIAELEEITTGAAQGEEHTPAVTASAPA